MTRTGSLIGTRVLAAETILTAVGNTTITGTLKLHELSTNGQHKVSISAPDSLSTDYSLTLPENQGDIDKVLSTNGSGILSWVDQTSGLEENVSVSGTLSVSGTTTLNSDTTINADLNISNDLNVSGTSTIDGVSTFNNNVTINGSLTVNGSSTYVYSENLVIKDPLIKLADNNASDNVDIGFYGEYNSKYSGLIRNPNDEEWYLFKDSNDDPPNMGNLEPANLNSNLDGGVVIKVIAKTTLSKGHAVYIHSDTDNDNTYVDKAIANDTSKMPSFGLILKDTNASSTGYVITLGNIINVIASDIVESGITLNNRDICYISASETGKITNVAPSSESNRIQNIGIVIRINNNKVSLRVGGAGRTNACPSLNHNNIFIGDSNNNVSTTSFNNALLNSNAVLTSGDQTIDDTKTFNNTINASITGNAGTVTNGIYTTSSVTDLSDISSSGSGQIITSAERTKLTNIEENADVTDTTNVKNAGAVMTTTEQTIDGTKTFNNTINASITGNAGTVTNGIYTTSSVTDLSDISSSGSGQIITSAERTKLTNFNTSYLNGSITNNQLANNTMTIDGTSVSLGESINTSNTTYTNGSGITLTGTTFSANVSDFMTNGVNNRILTATGTDGMNAEGKLTFDGSTLSVTGTTQVTGNIIPSANIKYDLGSSTKNFRDLYLSGATIHLGDTDLKSENNSLKVLHNGSTTLQKIRIDELEIGDDDNKIVLKKGSNNRLEIKTRDNNNIDTNNKIHFNDLDGNITNGMLSGSIANDKLAGSIANDKLVNDSITIDGTSVALGESINTSNTTYTNGSGITLTGTTFSANVDDTSIEHDTNDKISIKNSGVTNDMLSGSISNDKLAGNIENDKLVNSSMTINGTSVSLGGSITTPDTNTTYSAGTNIGLSGTTFKLDTSISDQTGITFLNSGAATNLTGSNYNNKPTTATYLDLSSATNTIPGGVLATKIQQTYMRRDIGTTYIEYSSNFRTSFVAQSANVMVEFYAVIAAYSSKLFYGALYDYINFKFFATSQTQHRYKFDNGLDQDPTSCMWYLTGLTAGTTYYISPYFKSSKTTSYIYAGHSGGIDSFAPGILRIIDGGNNVDIF